MRQIYTTGELAKMCNVSVRTVQYYDKQDILKPSDTSEGGRRLYTEDDLKKLRCICLYKSLGFSLEDIKRVVGYSDAFSLLSEIIVGQQSKMKEEILILQEKEQKLAVIYQKIKETGVKVESIDELDSLIEKKRQHRKTDIMTYIFMVSYLLVLVVVFPAAVSIGGFYPVIMSVTLIVLLLGLVYYHSQVNAYVCIHCHDKFTLGFFKDLFTLNGGKKGKYLTCPKCNNKGWFRETFPE